MLAHSVSLRYIVAAVVGCALFLFASLRTSNPVSDALTRSKSIYKFPTKYVAPSPVGVVTMQYGDQNELFERAIQSHVRHAERYGYPSFILRNSVYEEIWSKLAYMMAIVTMELAKDPGTRLKWLM